MKASLAIWNFQTFIARTAFLVLLMFTNPGHAQVARAATAEALHAGKGKVVKNLEHRMTPERLANFLQARTTTGLMAGSSFASYTSLLWGINEVGIWNEDANVGKIRLQNSFPEKYNPTWKELMDTLALQAGCGWHYDHETGYWVFEKKNLKYPFTLKTADGWQRREEGARVVFIPPSAPVGMDVYTMGHCSSEDPAKLPGLLTNAVKQISMTFARQFKANVDDTDFTAETVCGEPARYFSAPTPRDPKLKWRQWAFVKNGWCFIIVSVISEENEKQLLGDVNKMMSTFAVPEEN